MNAPLVHRSKICSAAEAVRRIKDGDTVATGGFVGIGFAEEIAVALEASYLAADDVAPGIGKPRNRMTRTLAGTGGRSFRIRS